VTSGPWKSGPQSARSSRCRRSHCHDQVQLPVASGRPGGAGGARIRSTGVRTPAQSPAQPRRSHLRSHQTAPLMHERREPSGSRKAGVIFSTVGCPAGLRRVSYSRPFHGCTAGFRSSTSFLVHRGVQKIHSFGAQASPEPSGAWRAPPGTDESFVCSCALGGSRRF
jgi:hypothetical protein